MFRLRKNALNYADEFSWDKSAQEFLEVLDCVWQSDEHVKLSRFYLTLNMFGTFAILRLFDLGDGARAEGSGGPFQKITGFFSLSKLLPFLRAVIHPNILVVAVKLSK
jgi:hypothetical protein